MEPEEVPEMKAESAVPQAMVAVPATAPQPAVTVPKVAKSAQELEAGSVAALPDVEVAE